jgi:hypothetical protein
LPRHLRRCLAVAGTAALAWASAVFGWTPDSQLQIGADAARLLPPDLYRQVDKHWQRYQDGILSPFRARDETLHQAGPGGGGRLEEVLALEVERTIQYIRSHRPFQDIVEQAGVVVHYSNDLHNPLNCSAADPREGEYFADFLDYLESVRPRVALVFHGTEPALDGGDLRRFLATTLQRCRDLYPLVGAEYRRIGKLPGRRYFDDRSTAFAVASLAHTRAVTDAALLLRHIWIAAGGADFRSPPSSTENRLVLLPRGAEAPPPSTRPR